MPFCHVPVVRISTLVVYSTDTANKVRSNLSCSKFGTEDDVVCVITSTSAKLKYVLLFHVSSFC